MTQSDIAYLRLNVPYVHRTYTNEDKSSVRVVRSRINCFQVLNGKKLQRYMYVLTGVAWWDMYLNQRLENVCIYRSQRIHGDLNSDVTKGPRSLVIT